MTSLEKKGTWLENIRRGKRFVSLYHGEITFCCEDTHETFLYKKDGTILQSARTLTAFFLNAKESAAMVEFLADFKINTKISVFMSGSIEVGATGLNMRFLRTPDRTFPEKYVDLPPEIQDIIGEYAEFDLYDLLAAHFRVSREN